MEAEAHLGTAAHSVKLIIDPKTKPPEGTSLEAWTERDHQVAAAILSTTSESILSAHIDLLSDVKTEAPRSRTIYDSLLKQYGTSGPQYSFALGRKFIESKCGEGEDVEAWVNQVQAQYRDLKLLSFDLDSLCINVLLNRLPNRFASFVDSIWKDEENPSSGNSLSRSPSPLLGPGDYTL
jgi:hypothetical protein